MAAVEEGLGPDDLRLARQRVARGARVTPLLPSDLLTERLGQAVALKCENLQAGGAFKIRGATNFVASLDDEARARGLITYSSGNHAIALSLAARRAGVPAVVVMPETAPAIKRERAKALGAELHFRGTTSLERHERARELAEERGLTMVRRSITPPSSPGSRRAASRSSSSCRRRPPWSSRSAAAGSWPASRWRAPTTSAASG